MALPVPGDTISGQYVYFESLNALGQLELTAVASDQPVTYSGTGSTVTTVTINGEALQVNGGFGAAQDPTAFTFGTPGPLGLGTTVVVVSNQPVIGTIGVGGVIVNPVLPLTTQQGQYAACFLSGSRLLTPSGEVAVETLAAGNLVTTWSGAVRPIKWVGRRSYTPSRLSHPEIVNPIRIARDAIAWGMPHRDLLVSPEHAIFLDGMLVPARHLVNGTTIVPVKTFKAIEYFHIELETHDVLVAEGLATESWLDTGNRGMFENAAEIPVQHPMLAQRTADAAWASDACAPLVISGPILAEIRCSLTQQALALGVCTKNPSLRLEVDGHQVAPTAISNGEYTFHVQPGASTMAIMSELVQDAPPEDERVLGVAVSSIVFWADSGTRCVSASDPALRDGFFNVEGSGATAYRWTNGRAVLPSELLDGLETGFDLIVTLVSDAAYAVGPVATAGERLAS